MSEFSKQACDQCLFNFTCETLGAENCDMFCTQRTDALYKAFMMGHDAGYEIGYEDCQANYDEEFGGYDEEIESDE